MRTNDLTLNVKINCFLSDGVGAMNLTQVIGDVRITRIQEMSGLGFTFKLMFPNYNKTEIEKHKHWLSPNYMGEENEQMYQSQSSWIIETPQTTIFIDL